MGQVTVTINGRSYRLRCGDGEESRLAMLADNLSLRVDRLAMDFGQHGDERLLIMAALLATDELLDAKSRLQALEAALETDPATTDRLVLPDAGAPLEPPLTPGPSANVAAAAPAPASLGNPTRDAAIEPPVNATLANRPTPVSTTGAAASGAPAPRNAAVKPAVAAAPARQPTPPRGTLEARLSEARNIKATTPPPKSGAA